MPVRMLSFLALLFVMSAQCALAYVDPGVTGMLFQMGYVAFYGALAFVAAFFRPIKMFFLTIKQKMFGAKDAASKIETADDIRATDDENSETEEELEAAVG